MTTETKSSPKPRYWRSFEELEKTPEFDEFLHREFPVAASELPDGVSRRRWIQIMGASLGLAGVAGCRYAEETIYPFVIRPEGRIPGEKYNRATNFELAGRVYHALVSCVDGRPLKVEGNTEHPAFAAAGTDAFSEACMLSLYDQERQRGEKVQVFRRESAGDRPRTATWDDFQTYANQWMKSQRAAKGEGTVVVVPPTQSPSLVRMLVDLQAALPSATFCRFDTVGGDVMHAATKQALGKFAEQRLDLQNADVIVALQSDLMGADSAAVRNTAGYAEGRDPDEQGNLNRLYCVEGGFSTTGAAADVRFTLRPSQMPAFLAQLEKRIDAGAAAPAAADEANPFDAATNPEFGAKEGTPGDPQDQQAWEKRVDTLLNQMAADLIAAGEKGVVVVGECMGADAVAAGIRINSKLGSLNKVQHFVTPIDEPIQCVGIDGLTEAMAKASSALILGCNVVYAAPGDIDMLTALSASNITDSIYIGDHDDETAQACRWSLPLAHPLESWGDVVDSEGHYGVTQPQILPLLDGRTLIQLVSGLLDDSCANGMLTLPNTRCPCQRHDDHAYG
ncbi:MAG: TAT-variant-translocated molybdopterin oxidoreductase, partial [Planctomycetota bacterium]